jgi:molecular chaperone Hsp33
MGIFVDSEQPYFRFKLEMNETGTFRNMLLHDKVLGGNNHWTGKIRLVKMMPNSKTPYQSVIEMDNLTGDELLNVILEQSYQSKCHLVLSESSDQVVLIHLLPQKNYDKHGFAPEVTLSEVVKQWREKLEQIMLQGLMEEQSVIKVFENLGLSYLSSKEISFYCPCSQQQMLHNLKKLGVDELQQILEEDGQIEIICDYCNHQYIFTSEDLQLKSYS